MNVIENRIVSFCKQFGNNIRVSGTDQLKVREWETIFKRHGFFMFPSHVAHDHVVDMWVLVSEPDDQILDCAQPWSTLIMLDPLLEYKDYRYACMERYCWQGDEFKDISSHPPGPRVDEEFISGVKETFYSGFPDLLPFEKNTYFFYGGASGEFSFCYRRFRDCVQEVREAFANGYTKIIFTNSDETSQPAFIMKAQRISEFFDNGREVFPQNTFFTVCAGAAHETIYEQLNEHNHYASYVVPLAFNRFECHAQKYLKASDEDVKYHCDRPYNTGVRPKKYLNFNRVPRLHRQATIADLHRRGLLEHGFNSFQSDADSANPEDEVLNFRDTFIGKIEQAETDINLKDCPLLMHEDYIFDLLLSLQEVYQTKLPMVLNRTSKRDNPVTIEMDDFQYYDNSYFSIVSETVFFNEDSWPDDFSYDSIFFSEKIFKPFIMKHPFVLIGFRRSLKELHAQGYKTFHPYIDESYDNVKNDFRRHRMILDEVERLCNLSDSEWVELQKNIQPIIEHNYKRVHDTNHDIRYTKHYTHRFIDDV